MQDNSKTSRDYRKLQVWVKAHEVALEVYRSSRAFPREELYGLTSQMRRAAASVPINIAEGCGRGGLGDLIRFMTIAQGSASELSYQVLLAHDLGYISTETHRVLAAKTLEVNRMLTAYLCKLRANG